MLRILHGLAAHKMLGRVRCVDQEASAEMGRRRFLLHGLQSETKRRYQQSGLGAVCPSIRQRRVFCSAASHRGRFSCKRILVKFRQIGCSFSNRSLPSCKRDAPQRRGEAETENKENCPQTVSQRNTWAEWQHPSGITSSERPTG